jgi:hypothetical protein
MDQSFFESASRTVIYVCNINIYVFNVYVYFCPYIAGYVIDRVGAWIVRNTITGPFQIGL